MTILCRHLKRGRIALEPTLFIINRTAIIIFLIDGWEYYSGRLLSPEDFSSMPPIPDEYLFIGHYGGFEAGSKNGSPHGSASYRLDIRIPEDDRSYALELPEIFSSYRLYINR